MARTQATLTAEVAAALDMNQADLTKVMRGLGIGFTPMSGRPYTPADIVIEEYKNLNQAGFSRWEIASRLGIKKTSLDQVLLRARKRNNHQEAS